MAKSNTDPIKWYTVIADDKVLGVVNKQQAKKERARIGELAGIIIRPATIEEQHKYVKA